MRLPPFALGLFFCFGSHRRLRRRPIAFPWRGRWTPASHASRRTDEVGDRPLSRLHDKAACRDTTSSAPCGGTFPSRGRLCGGARVPQAFFPQLPQTAPAASLLPSPGGEGGLRRSTLPRGLYNPGKFKAQPGKIQRTTRKNPQRRLCFIANNCIIRVSAQRPGLHCHEALFSPCFPEKSANFPAKSTAREGFDPPGNRKTAKEKRHREAAPASSPLSSSF